MSFGHLALQRDLFGAPFIAKFAMKMSVYWIFILCAPLVINTLSAFPNSARSFISHRQEYALRMTSLDDPRLASTDGPKSNSRLGSRSGATSSSSVDSTYDGAQDWDEGMEGYEGVDWHLEHARRMLEGPGFAPLRMTLWQPAIKDPKKLREPPGFLDTSKILVNNALQMMGLTKSLDGAPLVQGVNTFKGSPLKLLSRVLDGNLQELAGGPLFLLLHDYYKLYGPVYKLAFGPKSFIVVSDPVMVKHILKVRSKPSLFILPVPSSLMVHLKNLQDNPLNYDKGILAEILEPIMGKGLIPADPETWKVRRKAIVPGFHKAWLNAMVSEKLLNN
jgi:hypothetical protein